MGKDIPLSIASVLNKKFGVGTSVLMRDEDKSSEIEVLPTGLEVLDHHILRFGGLPVGRILEVYSEEGSGKSTLGYTFLAAAQRAGGIAALMDSEVSFDPDRAALFGVNNEDLLFSQPDHYDDLVAIVEHTISLIGAEKDIGPSVIVWDSIAATQTKAEFEGGYLGDDRMMARAAAMSKALRVLPGRVRKARVVLVCINQTRDKPGVMFGDKKTTPGGNALKFHASVRIQLFSGKAGKDAIGEHISKDVTVMAVKNRFAPPFRKAKLRLNYSKGWDNEWSVINHAKDKKVIPAATKASVKAYREACKALGWGAGLIIDAE